MIEPRTQTNTYLHSQVTTRDVTKDAGERWMERSTVRSGGVQGQVLLRRPRDRECVHQEAPRSPGGQDGSRTQSREDRAGWRLPAPKHAGPSATSPVLTPPGAHPESPCWTKTLPLPGNAKGWGWGCSRSGTRQGQMSISSYHIRLPRQKPTHSLLPAPGFPGTSLLGTPQGRGRVILLARVGALGAGTEERTPGTCRPAQPPLAGGLSPSRFP